MRHATFGAVVVMVGLSACGKADIEAVHAGADSGVGLGAGLDAGVSGSANASADSGANAGAHAWRGAYKSVESVITLPADVMWRVP